MTTEVDSLRGPGVGQIAYLFQQARDREVQHYCRMQNGSRRSAKELGVPISTVERTLAFARAWLFREILKSRNPQI